MNNKGMKYFYLLVLNFVASFAFGQVNLQYPVPVIDGKVVFSDVVALDSAKKDALYSKAKLWLSNAFKSAKDVIQLDDKDGGIILAKGVIAKNGAAKTYLNFSMKIQVKDGKYKAEIYDISYQYFVANLPQSDVLSLDDYFSDKRNYQKDGTPKSKTKKFGTEWASDLTPLLTGLKKEMSQELKSDF